MRAARVVYAIALLLPSLAAAQMATPIAVGSRVRITAAPSGDKKLTGTVMSLSADTLTLRQGAETNYRAFGISDISQIEVSTGTRTRKAKGALVGSLVGAASGALLAGALYKKPPPCDFICLYPPDTRGDEMLIAGVAGALSGALLGSLIGARPVDTWTPATIPGR